MEGEKTSTARRRRRIAVGGARLFFRFARVTPSFVATGFAQGDQESDEPQQQYATEANDKVNGHGTFSLPATAMPQKVSRRLGRITVYGPAPLLQDLLERAIELSRHVLPFERAVRRDDGLAPVLAVDARQAIYPPATAIPQRLGDGNVREMGSSPPVPLSEIQRGGTTGEQR